MSRVYLALVHYPVRDRAGASVTTAVTNLDVHDLARTARTYGLAGYYVVTPIAAQQALVARILEHWSTGSGVQRMPERAEALGLAEVCESVEVACERIAARHDGRAPRVVVTAARLPDGRPQLEPAALRSELGASDDPWLLLFGTGHGLAHDLLRRADWALAPIRPGHYNHLSVRAAAAILIDRLFGEAGAEYV